MTDTPLHSRRSLFGSGFAALGIAAAGIPMHAGAAMSVGVVALLGIAKAGLTRVGTGVTLSDTVGVADFGRASAQPRLHLVDLANAKITSFLVAHGKGSDPSHTGWLSTFSNAPGSEATSEGAFLTGDVYDGSHGRSMRLVGLDSTNNNALARAIVVHAAWYVSSDVVRSHGMIGRSEGCFAVSQADLCEVLTRLGPGRLLIATKT